MMTHPMGMPRGAISPFVAHTSMFIARTPSASALRHDPLPISESW